MAQPDMMLASLGETELRGMLLLGLSLATVAVIAYVLYSRLGHVAPSHVMMPFLGHLEELRVRVLRVVVVAAVWTVLFLLVRVETTVVGGLTVAYAVPSVYNNVASQIYAWIARTTVPPQVELFVATPMEAVGAQMEIALLLGLLLSLPFLLFELWAFLAPGLASRERRFLRLSLPPAFVLFVVGGSFGFFVAAPLLFRVLYGFVDPLGATALLSVGSLVSNVTTLVLLFGLFFELPLFMVGLVRLGLATPESYVRKWRHATVGIFIVAALASDPTLTSQLLIGSLLLGLYWGGVLASHFFRPPRPIVLPNRVSKA
ncbi:MAG: twin-arginine translocase subunit TatC [Euryarchaeota archaeon]|nr:twin-arginine translocase subunit TatC [Euryarchaeota archaeon]